MNMKKLLLILASIFCGFLLLNSCKSAIQKNAEKFTKELLLNPDSYEFVSLEFKDSIRIRECVDFKINQLEKIILINDTLSTYVKDVMNEYQAIGKQAPFYQAGLEQGTKELKRDREMLDFLKNIRDTQNLNKVCMYKYNYKIKSNNELDFRIPMDLILLSDPNHKVLQVISDWDNQYLNPYLIPGYLEKSSELSIKYGISN
jgi:hypothetical protein